MDRGRLACQLFTALVVLACVSSAVSGQSYAPLYGIHTSYPLVTQYANTEEFVQVVSDRGYSAIMYMIVEACPDTVSGWANHRFVSPTLESLGWTFIRDELSELVTAANSYDIEVIVDLQAMAYVALNPERYPLVAPPSVDDVVDVVHELAAYGIAGISEEMFLAEWFAPVYQACQYHGLTFTHKSIHWDFGAMTHYWNHTVFEIYSHCDVVMTEDYEMTADPPQMPACEQFPSVAECLGKEYHVKLSADDWALRSLPNMENVILLKALQFRPRYIYIMTWSSEHISCFDLANMSSLINQHISAEVKPICNIVLHLTGDEPPDTWDWWQVPAVLAPLSTGMKASGYDIITTPAPIADADMYYVYTRGKWKWGNTLDLPGSIVGLFDSGKPVFLHVTQILPNTTANWNTVRSKLGIDATEFELIANADTTLHGSYNGVEYAHLRRDGCSALNNIRPAHVVPPGEVLSTGNLNDTTYALIVRNGSNFFVNGTCLHLEASFPVSNAINDGLQKPAAFAGTAGNTSVFYALDVTGGQWDSTELHIRLPDASATEVRWFKRDFYGVVHAGTAPYDPNTGWVDTLGEGTLLIVKAEGGVHSPDHPPDPQVSGVSLLHNYPNPFSRSTVISYTLPVAGDRQLETGNLQRVSLKIYDLSGRLVKTLVDEPVEPGYHEVSWHGENGRGERVSSGLFFLRLACQSEQRGIIDTILTKKLTLLR